MAPSTRLDQDALFRVLEQQLDVIARQQALAAGLTKHALAHRLRPGGPWRGLLPGVYMAATGAPTTLQQEMAALLYAGPGSVITGPAALRSHHIRTELTEFVDVLVPSTRQRRDTNFVRLHRTSRMPTRIWEAGPVRYAPASRAVADAVRALSSLRDVRAVVADAVQRDKCAISNLAIELSQGPNKAARTGHRRRGGLKTVAHLARGSREDAGPRPAHGQVPDRRAPLHPPADPHSAGRGQKRHQSRPRRRPRSLANKAQDDRSG
jgi:hypothetical protein